MIRLLALIALIFGLVFSFAWLKRFDNPILFPVGDGFQAISLAQAVLAVVAVLAALVVVGSILVVVLRAPYRLGRASALRRQRLGREAIATGLLAVGAGDVRAAERAASEAHRRLPRAPLTRLLEAQAAQLAGERGEARRLYEQMVNDPQTRLMGLRGLYLEAMAEQEPKVAQHYAERALETSATTGWAAEAVLRTQVARRDWQGALQTLAKARDEQLFDKRDARRKRAVILTAAAMDMEDGDPAAAKQAALEAHDLAPELAPAAVVAGRLLTRAGDIRRAAKVLEASWKAEPHPEIAEAYSHVRPGDSPRDRLKRVDALHKMRTSADAGRLALAQAAIEAQEWETARQALLPIVKTRPTQNALLLMAEVEEAEHGDRGRARELMARALRAPRDPVWMADGKILDEWAPVSPVTGELDAVKWQIPAERERQLDGIAVSDEDLKPLPAPEPPEVVLDDSIEAIPLGEDELGDTAADAGGPQGAEVIDITPTTEPSGAKETEATDEAPPAKDAEKPKPAVAAAAPVVASEPAGPAEPVTTPESDDDSIAAMATAPVAPPANGDATKPEDLLEPAKKDRGLPRQPDDPGVTPKRSAKEDRRQEAAR